MTKLGKIIILGIIIVVLAAAGFFIWSIDKKYITANDWQRFLDRGKITTFEECEKAVSQIRIVSPSVRECSTPSIFFGLLKSKTFRKIVIPPPGFQIEAIKEFRTILDAYRKLGRKRPDTRFELVDNQTLPTSFNFYQEATAEPVVRKYVSVFSDDVCFDWKTNEYEVNIETNKVVSMRPVKQNVCWFPSLERELYREITDEQGNSTATMVEWQYDTLAKPPLSDEELKQTAIDFLTELLGEAELKEVESSFDFSYDSNYDQVNYWGNYFFRWQNNNYTPPKGCAILMPPFIQVGITKSGHIFSYENTASFFEDLPSNCRTPQVELIPSDFSYPALMKKAK